MLGQTICPNCKNRMRDANLSVPCDVCSSRKFPVWGYQYPHEARDKTLALILIVVVTLVACIIGVSFLAITQYLLAGM